VFAMLESSTRAEIPVCLTGGIHARRPIDPVEGVPPGSGCGHFAARGVVKRGSSTRLLKLDHLTVGVADPDLCHIALRSLQVVDPR
jgi:hypothetical protein